MAKSTLIEKIELEPSETRSAMDICSQLMNQDKYKNGKTYTINIVFGMVYVRSYNRPSDINFRDIGVNHLGLKEGYWKDGKFFEHSKAKKIKYQNWGLGCE